jgi:two-component system, chemotaxis family, response regulator PixG
MIVDFLKNLQQQSFTGVAHIQPQSKDRHSHWRIYFYFGKLIWANGGCHSYRSWMRHLTQYCPQINLDQVDVRSSDLYKCQEYHILGLLLQRNSVKLETVTELITNKIQETFFDIFQKQETETLESEAEEIPLSSLIEQTTNKSFIFIDLDGVFAQSQQQWLTWKTSGFVDVNPNNAPQIISQEQLQQAVPAVVYQNFIKLLDGRRTLRDLAVGMNKDLLLLTKSIYPYVQKKLLQLVEVPDLRLIKNTTNSEKNLLKQKKNSSNKPLIACIDDSPQICQIMNQIITQADYRFLGIQQPIQAVPSLINANPKMIFLDIGMPILNGYEVCTQIRRVSKLQEVPIIMLTGNDGVFDRVKAKVCGASDFLSKPIEIEKILKTIEKFSTPNAMASN